MCSFHTPSHSCSVVFCHMTDIMSCFRRLEGFPVRVEESAQETVHHDALLLRGEASDVDLAGVKDGHGDVLARAEPALLRLGALARCIRAFPSRIVVPKVDGDAAGNIEPAVVSVGDEHLVQLWPADGPE